MYRGYTSYFDDLAHNKDENVSRGKKTFCYELMFMHMLNIDSGCGRKCSVVVRNVMGMALVVILRLVGAVSMAVLFHI